MTVEIVPVEGLPELEPGDDLAGIVADALGPIGLLEGDVVAVTQKIVSKAEGRLVREGEGGRSAWVERETRRVVARRGDLVISETRHGFVCANAGVDASNVAEGWLTLLPDDPDASAEHLREALRERFGVEVGVVVTDTFGRPWREGVVDVAIGCAGLPALVDLRGSPDHHGRALESTVVALADQVAAASGLVTGKAARVPVAVLRGLGIRSGDAARPGRALVRDETEDLFRESPLQAVASHRSAERFAPGEVPRAALEDAVRAATRASSGMTFVVAISAAARRRVAALLEDASAGEAGALVVAVLHRGVDDEIASLEVGAALERLRLALRALGFGSALVEGDRDAVAAALGIGEGSTPLAVVAVGRTREGAASPRPPVDLSALLRFE